MYTVYHFCKRIQEFRWEAVWVCDNLLLSLIDKLGDRVINSFWLSWLHQN